MQRIDVLIVTAIREEYAAVRAVDAGARAGSAWEVRTAPTGLEIRVRPFVAGSGGELWVAVTQALGMGGVEAVSACAQLVAAYQVRCLAMCGVCAGRRGEVALGDVIIADRMWTHDTGKRKVEVDESGRKIETETEDIEMYRIAPPSWKHAAERFAVDPTAAWPATRPRSYEAQGDWVLERVLHGHDPATDPESKAKCADFDKALARLWKRKLLRDGTLALTAKGKKHIDRVLLQNRGELPEPPAFRTRVGPMATGSRVLEDAGIFEKLSTPVRKVLGLEMEAAAIGGLGWARSIGHVIVMKGVMDHADAEKNDNFKAFAARASAECLLQFVRENLRVVGEAEDPILVRETSPLPAKFGPAALLNARHAVVGFIGREALLGSLQGWCEKEGRIEAKLIHAAGGMGKTRLAMELCKRMRAAGWRVGFVPKSLGVDRFVTLVQSDEPVLAVMDYAERRGQLREMLEEAAARRGEKDKDKKKLRLLLLSRNADDWWADLARSDGAVKDLLSEDPIVLEAVDVERKAVFWAAVGAFAEKLDKEAPGSEAPSLAHPRYELALYVHMAALAAVEGRPVKDDQLVEDTLDHEERLWRGYLRDRGPTGERIAAKKMRRIVSALTLIGGVRDAAEAHALIDDEDMELLLHDLYPGSAGRYISALEPDLLGEAMVLWVLREEGGGAGSYLNRVLEGATERALRMGLEVLGRLSEHCEQAKDWIAHVLRRDVAGRAMAALEAAKSVGEHTAHSDLGRVLAEVLKRDGTVEIAKQLGPELPDPHQTVSLLELGEWVFETRFVHLPEDAHEDRAAILNNLSLWQNALGKREAALASAVKAVTLYRRLAEMDPAAFVPNLATSVHNLSLMQNEMGQRGAALVSAQEAVSLHRRLAKTRPTSQHDLALSLNNLSNLQTDLGQQQAALGTATEAMAIYRQLAQVRPDVHQPDLAMSLHNLGRRHYDLGQWPAAIACFQEASARYRTLAQARPDSYEPDLAASLNSLGALLGELGKREEAIASLQEAADLRRRLADKQPEKFEHELAASLGNISNVYSDLGHQEKALALAEQAEAIYRRLAQMQPAVFLPDLAMALDSLGSRQRELHQWGASLVSATNAEALYRQLAKAHPDAFLPGLAMSLNNLGNTHSALNQHESALASIREAVSLYRRLVESNPDRFLPDLATSLDNLALGLHKLGRLVEALPIAEEALDVLWPVYERFPEAHGDRMRHVLRTMADLLNALGQPPGKRFTQRMTRYLARSGS